MNKQTLKNYFRLCKDYDQEDFEKIVHNIENKKLRSIYPQLSNKDIDTVSNLKNALGGDQVGKKQLIELYVIYKMKGGQSSLSKLSSLIQKQITWNNTKSLLQKTASTAKTIITAAGSVIAKAALEDPDGTVNIMKTVHNSITTQIINAAIKDEEKRKTVNDVFNNGFEVFGTVLKSIKEENKVAATTQSGGQYYNEDHDYDDQYDDYQYGGQYDDQDYRYNNNDQYGGQYSDQDDQYNNDQYNNDQYNNDQYNNDQYGGQYSDQDNRYNNDQYGGQYSDQDDRYNNDQYGGQYSDQNDRYNNDQYGGQYSDKDDQYRGKNYDDILSIDHNDNYTSDLQDQTGGNFSDTSDFSSQYHY